MENQEEDSNATLNGAPDNNDHGGKGKIARLPRALRDQVNTMLREGVSYPEIRRKFLDMGHSEFEEISEDLCNQPAAGRSYILVVA